MPPVNFRVSQPESVTRSFRDILILARSQGRQALVLRAGRYMLDELAYDPMRYGESRNYFPAARIWERLAFAPPLEVRFGVHEESKQVFIFELAIN